ncbi:hypothetical protein Cadr_000022524 [Camelus dromedarius]|uniref:Uncharacterized protein n=1 Tax=Camelus dromedarius TaxID=9838 RepID=A0A5N4CS70_CAMDR|nr:hypothetical protein Cadr_000022524 [Camelus dromedarius]
MPCSPGSEGGGRQALPGGYLPTFECCSVEPHLKGAHPTALQRWRASVSQCECAAALRDMQLAPICEDCRLKPHHPVYDGGSAFAASSPGADRRALSTRLGRPAPRGPPWAMAWAPFQPASGPSPWSAGYLRISLRVQACQPGGDTSTLAWLCPGLWGVTGRPSDLLGCATRQPPDLLPALASCFLPSTLGTRALQRSLEGSQSSATAAGVTSPLWAGWKLGCDFSQLCSKKSGSQRHCVNSCPLSPPLASVLRSLLLFVHPPSSWTWWDMLSPVTQEVSLLRLEGPVGGRVCLRERLQISGAWSHPGLPLIHRSHSLLTVTTLRIQANKAACIQNIPGHMTWRRGAGRATRCSLSFLSSDSCSPITRLPGELGEAGEGRKARGPGRPQGEQGALGQGRVKGRVDVVQPKQRSVGEEQTCVGQDRVLGARLPPGLHKLHPAEDTCGVRAEHPVPFRVAFSLSSWAPSSLHVPSTSRALRGVQYFSTLRATSTTACLPGSCWSRWARLSNMTPMTSQEEQQGRVWGAHVVWQKRSPCKDEEHQPSKELQGRRLRSTSSVWLGLRPHLLVPLHRDAVGPLPSACGGQGMSPEGQWSRKSPWPGKQPDRAGGGTGGRWARWCLERVEEPLAGKHLQEAVRFRGSNICSPPLLPGTPHCGNGHPWKRAVGRLLWTRNWSKGWPAERGLPTKAAGAHKPHCPSPKTFPGTQRPVPSCPTWAHGRRQACPQTCSALSELRGASTGSLVPALQTGSGMRQSSDSVLEMNTSDRGVVRGTDPSATHFADVRSPLASDLSPSLSARPPGPSLAPLCPQRSTVTRVHMVPELLSCPPAPGCLPYRAEAPPAPTCAGPRAARCPLTVRPRCPVKCVFWTLWPFPLQLSKVVRQARHSGPGEQTGAVCTLTHAGLSQKACVFSAGKGLRPPARGVLPSLLTRGPAGPPPLPMLGPCVWPRRLGGEPSELRQPLPPWRPAPTRLPVAAEPVCGALLGLGALGTKEVTARQHRAVWVPRVLRAGCRRVTKFRTESTPVDREEAGTLTVNHHSGHSDLLCPRLGEELGSRPWTPITSLRRSSVQHGFGVALAEPPKVTSFKAPWPWKEARPRWGREEREERIRSEEEQVPGGFLTQTASETWNELWGWSGALARCPWGQGSGESALPCRLSLLTVSHRCDSVWGWTLEIQGFLEAPPSTDELDRGALEPGQPWVRSPLPAALQVTLPSAHTACTSVSTSKPSAPQVAPWGRAALHPAGKRKQFTPQPKPRAAPPPATTGGSRPKRSPLHLLL